MNIPSDLYIKTADDPPTDVKHISLERLFYRQITSFSLFQSWIN